MQIGDLVVREGGLGRVVGIITKMEERPYGRGGPEATVYWMSLGLCYDGYELSELELYDENR